MNDTDVKGIWSGIPMPWTDTEQLDHGALVRTIQRCVETGSHGIYVAGTTGEFHAMGEAQFRDVVETFVGEMRNHPGVGAQVGCGGFSWRQVRDRVQVSVDTGCMDIQLPLPGWMPLQDDEVLGFFAAVTDHAPGVRIYIYDNIQSGRLIGEAMWPRLLERFPNIAGAKLTDPTPDLVRAIIHARPEFNILGSETSIIELWSHGARSVAAWISYAFPALINDLWRALERNDAAGIAGGGQILDIIHGQIKDPMRPRGYREGIMDRLMGVASGFLEPVFCRALKPWRSVKPEDVALARAMIEEHLGHEHTYG